MSLSVADLLERARKRISRVNPEDLDRLLSEGALVVDIRPAAQRQTEGVLPGAVVVERNVFEWRLDPRSEHRLPEVRDHTQPVVVVCSEGFASSLAAATLTDLGFEQAADLAGGYKAWSARSKRLTPD
jgi:rhodanese-related sulfurtransferase